MNRIVMARRPGVIFTGRGKRQPARSQKWLPFPLSMISLTSSSFSHGANSFKLARINLKDILVTHSHPHALSAFILSNLHGFFSVFRYLALTQQLILVANSLDH